LGSRAFHPIRAVGHEDEIISSIEQRAQTLLAKKPIDGFHRTIVCPAGRPLAESIERNREPGVNDRRVVDSSEQISRTQTIQ